ncbi:APC family permease [Loigolactobacillus binensis]|uniref:APC family permease n=1 Tax=Loigolactobacillus binensis TaxID=2559922 RepID=A0ABW3EFK5_9LACO|nr:amino acid permease [Loigolactobacillus binensis]
MKKKQLFWYNIAFIAFASVWGLGNVVNNFTLEGMSVVTSWLLIAILYFIPYTLIVGQLGATFKNDESGVAAWIRELTTPKIAYLAAWTFWVVNITYLAQKPQTILIAFSWLLRGNGDFVNQVASIWVQLICLGIFLFFLWLASRGIVTLKRIGSIAGIGLIIMSLLFIILAFAAFKFSHVTVATQHMAAIKTYLPKWDLNYLTTISMLVFAVGGAEKIAPYVNKTQNAGREFPLGMIALAVLVIFSALSGSIAMGLLFNAKHIPKDLLANGAYYAFAKLDNYYHVGHLFQILYAIANALEQIAALLFSIDAPLKMLLGDHADFHYIPRKLVKRNKHDALINGYLLTGVLVSILIILPALYIGNMNELFDWLLNLNSVVLPMRFLWVFAAFILLNRQFKHYQSDFYFIKRPLLGKLIGGWCFLFTAFACLLGMIPKTSGATWWTQLELNIATPIIFVLLGVILPVIARWQNRQRVMTK